jgi:hypothetical protein
MSGRVILVFIYFLAAVRSYPAIMLLSLSKDGVDSCLPGTSWVSGQDKQFSAGHFVITAYPK